MLANNKIKEILSNYEKPPIDEGIEEALIEYIAKRKASLPDSLV